MRIQTWISSLMIIEQYFILLIKENFINESVLFWRSDYLLYLSSLLKVTIVLIPFRLEFLFGDTDCSYPLLVMILSSSYSLYPLYFDDRVTVFLFFTMMIILPSLMTPFTPR